MQYVKMWERTVKKMNDAVTPDKEKLVGAEPITGLTAHIPRHNYCTMLYCSGISQKKAVELMGHKHRQEVGRLRPIKYRQPLVIKPRYLTVKKSIP